MEDENKGKRYSLFVPWFTLGWLVKSAPDNFITCTPKRLFGFFIGYYIVCAKKGYKYRDGKVQN